MKKKFLKYSSNETNIWEAENIFYLLSKTNRLIQVLNLYEIYKNISNLEGDILECGVFKGSSLIKLMTFRKILGEEKKRKIYGFDVFGKFPEPKLKKDKKFLKNWENKVKKILTLEELNYHLKKKNFKNFELIKGNITNTIPKFLKRKKNLKISLLHLDMDIYEGTSFALNKLFSRVVKNGIIVIDDYKTVHGATIAVDEFLKKNPKYTIKKVKNYKKPSIIIKKF